MPDESGVLDSSPTWKDARSLARSLLNVTVTQSPAATWATSGSGFTAPLLTSAATVLGTNAAAAPWGASGTSTALIVRFRGVASSGHGLPAPAAGGSPPVCSSCVKLPVGTVRPG